MNRNNHCGCKNCNQQLESLRILDFCIQETVLYLDAYPDCCEALNYYHQLISQREEALAQYERNCGPMTMYGNTDKTAWNWVRGPWPWECDAN